MRPRSTDHRPLTTYGVAYLSLILVVATVWTYRGSFQGALIHDDLPHIKDNPTIRSLWPVGKIIDGRSRPLVMLSVAVNHALGGLEVAGYHAFNLTVHILAGLALFGVIRRSLHLIGEASSTEPDATLCIGPPATRTTTEPRATILAFSVALLWLVHPLQTESVTYIIQRAESMMGMCFLLSLYCVIRGATGSPSWLWYTAGCLTLSLGMGCKEVMITAPFVILAYDRVFLATKWREVFLRRGWLYVSLLPALAWLGWTIGLARMVVPGGSAGFGYRAVTPGQYLISQAGVIVQYLRLSVWPDQLCLDYRWPAARTWDDIVIPGAMVVGLLMTSLVALRYRPALGFLGIAFFMILAPTSSIMPIADLAVEHRMYLPLAPLLVLVVLATECCAGRGVRSPMARRLLLSGILVIVAVVLAQRTHRRNLQYQDPIAMWDDVLQTAPHNERAYENCGLACAEREEWLEAAVMFEMVTQRQPEHVLAHQNLGLALVRLGNIEAAVGPLRKTLELNPGSRTAVKLLAWIMATALEANLRNGHEAVAMMESLIGQGDGSDLQAFDILAAAYAEEGTYADAIRTALTALRLANAAHETQCAREIQMRLKCYRAGKPWRAMGKRENMLDL